MTLQEIGDELKSLRDQEQARMKNWRPIRIAAAFCGIVCVLAGIGLLVFSVVYAGRPSEALQTAVMFIMLSLSMSLLGAALR